jgi:hypothetical protein
MSCFLNPAVVLVKEDRRRRVSTGNLKAGRKAGNKCFYCRLKLRSCKRDSAATVLKGLLAHTVNNGLDYTNMKKGKMYDDELLQATETHNFSASTRSVNGWSEDTKTERTKKGESKEGDASKGNRVPSLVRSVHESGRYCRKPCPQE